MRFIQLLLLFCLLAAGAQAQTSNLWRPQPNPTPPPCPQIRQFYNVSGSFQQVDCNGVVTTISAGANLQDPGANGILARTAVNTTAARTLTGTANRIVITNGNGVPGNPTFDIGANVATNANNLSFFAATTSAQLAGVISDETGSGALVFNSSPSLTTPTIANFTNAAHNHEGAAGGGQLNASNVFSAGAVTLARGGTGSSLADPNAHRLLGWDDTDNQVRFFVIGSGLNYDAATDTLSVTVGGLVDPGANGIVARTALNTTAARTLTAPAAGFTITNANGSGGNPTFVLANDLGALEGLGGTGFAARVTTDTWALRTITGTANQVTVTEGAGIAGNPVLSLPTTVYLGTPGGSPVAGILKGPDASGTNIAGADVYVAGGPGTGNAAPGVAAFRYPLTTSSGSAGQTLSTATFPPVVSMFIRNNGDVTVANTTTETSVLGAAQAGSTKTIEAGLARVGRTFYVRLYGTLGITGTPTLRLRIKLGSTTIVDTTAATINVPSSGGGFLIEGVLSIRAVGASGEVMGHTLKGTITPFGSAGGNMLGFAATAAVTPVDFTVAQAIDVTVQWGTANAANTLTITGSFIDMSR